MSRPSVARVCAELDLLKEHLIRIRLGVDESTYFQSIFYENIPQYCAESHSTLLIAAQAEISHGGQIVSPANLEVQRQVTLILDNHQTVTAGVIAAHRMDFAAMAAAEVDLPIIDPSPELQATEHVALSSLVEHQTIIAASQALVATQTHAATETLVAEAAAAMERLIAATSSVEEAPSPENMDNRRKAMVETPSPSRPQSAQPSQSPLEF
ncbi:OLC1v1019496C1 [Oldenlandia corymbosa var. corymbosa]|uniref:OLC1v1019496C1 n=1 Tax=Oldenlandia corymbosa var. corymbosa TaxID=529605 RepID=A0AAV1EE26_OLDCO|nr:OLC1v1019496C1 [Oldenlandia corymbosa var. corymbosa]